ncbi:TldD/PmbA family protein [Candidatus Gracilibacteria bacterium]|nr:TldD/PmbA family protein [Candidatus Gracilibacteria bacterium]
MQLTKQDTQKYLNSFSGEYKELFFEKSKNFGFSFINGIGKTPILSTLEGFSILSRSGNKEYFKVYNDFLDIEDKINNFKNEFLLNNTSENAKLNGDDILKLENIEDIKFDVKDILENIKKVYEIILKNEKIIVSSDMSLSLSCKQFIVGNNSGNFAKDSNYYNTFFIKLIGEKNGNKEEVFEKITGDNILDKLNFENISSCVKKRVKTLKDVLDGEASPNGEMDVIIGNEAGGTIIHEAIGHGLEADLQNSSVYNGKIGQKVAQDFVSVVDNPKTVGERGYYKYDHEGNTAKEVYLIENGILKNYLHTTKTSKKFETLENGHARRENYKYKTLVRMGNTYLLPGKDKKEDLIKKVKNGIYVSRMGGGQVNTTTGDFVFKVQSGYLIENGRLTNVIRGATLSGNGPKMLNEIYGICDDLEFFDGGTCGKGQAMPVSDGTPTVWTKLKVSSF